MNPKYRQKTPILVLFSLTALAFAPVGVGQEDPPSLPEVFNEPIALYTEALGSFTRPISSSNSQAQAYFDQGFQMMYAFVKQDAVRSFRESQTRATRTARSASGAKPGPGVRT